MRILIVTLFALVMALPAHAWNLCGSFDANSASTAAPNALRGANSAGPTALCHDTSGTTASPILSILADHFSIQLTPDVDGGVAGCEVTVYRCTSRDATSSALNTCTAIWPDSDFDGAPNSGVFLDGVTIGRRGLDWQSAKHILVFVNANTGPKNCRTMISGH